MDLGSPGFIQPAQEGPGQIRPIGSPKYEAYLFRIHTVQSNHRHYKLASDPCLR